MRRVLAITTNNTNSSYGTVNPNANGNTNTDNNQAQVNQATNSSYGQGNSQSTSVLDNPPTGIEGYGLNWQNTPFGGSASSTNLPSLLPTGSAEQGNPGFEAMAAELEGLGETANKVASPYQTSLDSFVSLARANSNEAFQALGNIFANPSSEEVSVWQTQKSLAIGGYNYNSAMAQQYGFFASAANTIRNANLDVAGLALEGAGAAVDIMMSNNPSKTTFVDSAGIWGGRIGTAFGVGAAFGEEVALPIFSTPGAISTIAGSNLLGTAIFKTTAGIIWDASDTGEALLNNAETWVQNFRR